MYGLPSNENVMSQSFGAIADADHAVAARAGLGG